jgi:hypothetical protein
MIPGVYAKKRTPGRGGFQTRPYFRPLLLIGLLTCFAVYLLATSTPYTQPFTTGHGWTYTQVSCAGGATCTSGDVADGNPTPGVYAKVVGKNKAQLGYFSHTYTWENLGVPAGESVQTVNGQWDDKSFQTAVACTSSTTMGMLLYDSGNTVAITTATVEPDLNVAGDTAAWTNHNPTGAVDVIGSYAISSTTITLRFDLNPASGNNSSAACEVRGDNYALTVVSVASSGRHTQTIVAFAAPRVSLDLGWLWGVTERLEMPIANVRHLEAK